MNEIDLAVCTPAQSCAKPRSTYLLFGAKNSGRHIAVRLTLRSCLCLVIRILCIEIQFRQNLRSVYFDRL